VVKSAVVGQDFWPPVPDPGAMLLGGLALAPFATAAALRLALD
jgi:hypothetical protein